MLNVTHTGRRAYADETELIFLVRQISCVPLHMPQAISTAEFQRTSLFKRCDTSLEKKKSEKFQRTFCSLLVLGLACQGVHLFVSPLCKKHIWEPTAFIATPAKSLHGNRKNP